MKIPEWVECNLKDVKSQTMTALECFIHKWEPIDQGSGVFRAELQTVVDEIKRGNSMKIEIDIEKGICINVTASPGYKTQTR